MKYNKYWQVIEMPDSGIGASNKARSDVAYIVSKLGFQSITIESPQYNNVIYKIKSKIIFVFNLISIKYSKLENSVLLLQIPFINMSVFSHKFILKKCKKHHIKIIAFVHDINELRGNHNKKANDIFIELLKNASAIISHNENMSQYLVKKGIYKDKIINLEIFDYLIENVNKQETEFSKEVSIAGNLSNSKSTYIDKLSELSGIVFNLYGPNYQELSVNDNIKYHGVFNAENLPNEINKGFGLVWDGTTISTCDGVYGSYLRYNNPHKLSLYIASGIPVIVWSESAEAEFVVNNNIGISVSSLYELESIIGQIGEESYLKLLGSLKTIQEKVITGYYAKAAITKAVMLLESE